ncbi:MAG TPA: aspartate aminotransferase family protein [Alphaproteobacteria bacterium]|nr:aspartate aminotransferase family protein [Alphaproteobacteria bacterium]
MSLNLAPRADEPVAADLYAQHVNPQWVKLLDVLQMNVEYARCENAELHTVDPARLVLDFNSGYCVHNIGHNHPRLIEALKRELDSCGPAMLQSHVPDLAGELGARLCALAGGRLNKVHFASSGSEGVETAIKFSRAHTGRRGLLYAADGFHGLTCGALSLMSNPYWTDGFGPFLPETAAVPFGDAAALERHLATGQFAAFIVEPIQAEAGVRLPPERYLRTAQTLCRRYGTLFVLDEVQTGLYRTGTFLAAHQFGVKPDIVVLAKALSGGLVPCSAVLMSEPVFESVYSSLRRAMVHTSTYSENGLAMRAGLATLDVLDEEELGLRATAAGETLRQALTDRIAGYEMVGEVRGLGLLNAIEFRPPRSTRLRIAFEAFARLHPAVFGQMIVMRLFRDHGVLAQVCGNNFMALKLAPPLTVSRQQIEHCVTAVTKVIETVHRGAAFWSDGLGLVRRAVRSL